MKKIFFLLFIMIISGSCIKNNESKVMLNDKISQFSPTELSYDEAALTENQKQVILKIFQAARIMDDIFLEQVYSRNREIKEELMKKNETEALAYFNIMFGPFDRLDHNKPFYGNFEKPKGANFYPEDMTKKEFETWIQEHPEDEESFTSEFTMIRRENGNLVAIPYSEYFKEPLGKAAQFLREAADYADNPTLRKYLETRADAFESNDYYESDMAWMDLKDHTIEVVIGPYEVYEDELFNYKAAFECFLTIRDADASEKLKVFGSFINEMEKNLPIPDEHKNFGRGSESPIVVVQQVYSSGDTKAGIQTIAFNLPNDERVREAKGSKKVLMKNLHEAKFKKQLMPIAQLILNEDELKNVTFDGFFNHVLMHEMSHGVGPGKIIKNGQNTEAKKELKETYSTLEECKADVLGMYNNILMIEKGVYTREFEKEIWPSFLGGVFRSIRFGINEAHGAGNAIIFNYMYQNNAYIFDEATETLSINYDKVYDTLKSLATELLMIQALGDYEAAKTMIETYGKETEIISRIREKLTSIPIDIKPVYSIEKKF
jgi:hypothetical protein